MDSFTATIQIKFYDSQFTTYHNVKDVVVINGELRFTTTKFDEAIGEVNILHRTNLPYYIEETLGEL